ncbi:HIT family protein [Candidatus Woesearchaeota archaeon]|nr:HIT family protein [Candidatus Woesearchaeota archaeon]
MNSQSTCPFCDLLQKGEFLEQRESAVVIRDAFPVSAGHLLVISRMHEEHFTALDSIVRNDMLALATEMADRALKQAGVTGCNIGVNVGRSAGQTVMHAHLHVIPRREGDVADPRGGVRWVVPSKAKYWD